MIEFLNNLEFFVPIILFIPFVFGVVLRQKIDCQEPTKKLGVRLVWLFVPTFIIGWFASEVLLKDWSKNEASGKIKAN